MLSQPPVHVLHMLTFYARVNSVRHMGRMVQIRNMPEPMHRKLKARAAEDGLSLSDYLLRELKKAAEQPTLDEILERLRQRESFQPRTPAARVLRQERDRR